MTHLGQLSLQSAVWNGQPAPLYRIAIVFFTQSSLTNSKSSFLWKPLVLMWFVRHTGTFVWQHNGLFVCQLDVSLNYLYQHSSVWTQRSPEWPKASTDCLTSIIHVLTQYSYLALDYTAVIYTHMYLWLMKRHWTRGIVPVFARHRTPFSPATDCRLTVHWNQWVFPCPPRALAAGFTASGSPRRGPPDNGNEILISYGALLWSSTWQPCME